MKTGPKIVAILLYGSLTLNGEYGIPVWLDIIFRVTNLGILDISLALIAGAAMVIILLDIYNSKPRKIWIVSWFALLLYLIPYSIQPQEHVSPFNLKETFIWQVLLLVIFLIFITIRQSNIESKKTTASVH